MFCPENYVPFSRLYDRILDFDNKVEAIIQTRSIDTVNYLFFWPDYVRYSVLMHLCKDAMFVSDGFTKPIRLDAKETMISCLFMHCFDGLPSSSYRNDAPDFEIAEDIKHRFGFCTWSDEQEKEAFNICCSDDPTEQHIDRYRHLISLRKHFGQPAPPLFIDRITWTINFDLYDMLSAHLAESTPSRSIVSDASRIAVALRPLNGMALCVPERIMKEDWSKHWKAMVKHWDQLNSDGSMALIGRPRVRDKAAATYKVLFPDGHSGMTWKQVMNAINTRMGDVCSTDTLKRGLGLK